MISAKDFQSQGRRNMRKDFSLKADMDAGEESFSLTPFELLGAQIIRHSRAVSREKQFCIALEEHIKTTEAEKYQLQKDTEAVQEKIESCKQRYKQLLTTRSRLQESISTEQERKMSDAKLRKTRKEERESLKVQVCTLKERYNNTLKTLENKYPEELGTARSESMDRLKSLHRRRNDLHAQLSSLKITFIIPQNEDWKLWKTNVIRLAELLKPKVDSKRPPPAKRFCGVSSGSTLGESLRSVLNETMSMMKNNTTTSMTKNVSSQSNRFSCVRDSPIRSASPQTPDHLTVTSMKSRNEVPISRTFVPLKLKSLNLPQLKVPSFKTFNMSVPFKTQEQDSKPTPISKPANVIQNEPLQISPKTLFTSNTSSFPSSSSNERPGLSKQYSSYHEDDPHTSAFSALSSSDQTMDQGRDNTDSSVLHDKSVSSQPKTKENYMNASEIVPDITMSSEPLRQNEFTSDVGSSETGDKQSQSTHGLQFLPSETERKTTDQDQHSEIDIPEVDLSVNELNQQLNSDITLNQLHGSGQHTAEISKEGSKLEANKVSRVLPTVQNEQSHPQVVGNACPPEKHDEPQTNETSALKTQDWSISDLDTNIPDESERRAYVRSLLQSPSFTYSPPMAYGKKSIQRPHPSEKPKEVIQTTDSLQKDHRIAKEATAQSINPNSITSPPPAVTMNGESISPQQQRPFEEAKSTHTGSRMFPVHSPTQEQQVTMEFDPPQTPDFNQGLNLHPESTGFNFNLFAPEEVSSLSPMCSGSALSIFGSPSVSQDETTNGRFSLFDNPQGSLFSNQDSSHSTSSFGFSFDPNPGGVADPERQPTTSSGGFFSLFSNSSVEEDSQPDLSSQPFFKLF